MKTVFKKLVGWDDSDYTFGSPMWFEWFAATYKSELIAACGITDDTTWQVSNFGLSSAWLMESPFAIRLTASGREALIEVVVMTPAEFTAACL